jgi:hypothetical protein
MYQPNKEEGTWGNKCTEKLSDVMKKPTESKLNSGGIPIWGGGQYVTAECEWRREQC